MSSSSKGFHDAEEQLEELYAKCDTLMADDSDSSLIKSTISSINSVFAEMERFVISETCVDSKELLQNRLKKHIEDRCNFDERLSNFFKGKLPEKETASLLSVPRTLRSRTSKTSSKKSSSFKSKSTSSSMAAAKLLAKEEVAKLKLKQLEERRAFERKQKKAAQEERIKADEERRKIEEERRRAEEKCKKIEEERRRAEMERKEEEQFILELLKARHEVEEASLERQVVEEETERGGYIPFESESKPFLNPEIPTSRIVPSKETNLVSKLQFQTKPLETDLPTSSRLVSEKETKFVTSEQDTPRPRYPCTDFHQKGQQAPGKFSYNIPVHTDFSVPKIELAKFNGNPMNYIRFARTFEANVESVVSDPGRRLLLLIQHCEGEAKKLIDYCLLLEPYEGYNHARALLRDTYGRRNQIARAFIDKLHSGTIIKRDDKTGLVNLARDLEECDLTFKQLNLHSSIDNFDAIGKIVQRLPYDLQIRWIREASQIERTGEEPTINDLIHFVKREAEVVKSAYSKFVYQKSKRVSSFLTSSKEIVTEGNSKCHLCLKDHLLKNCFAFRDKGLNDRYDFVKQKRLCFNCFRQGHVARNCHQNKTIDQ